MSIESENETPTGRDHLTRRQALGYGGAAAAAAAAASVLTSSPASASTPEAEDEGSGGGRSQRLPSISLAQANRVAAAAVRYVRDHPELPPMYVVVVDAFGDEKASRRMDGNAGAALELVPRKARTAAAFSASTADLAAGTAGNPARIASFTTAEFSLLGGGQPIREGEGDDAVVIGAIGVGGGSPEQDDRVALAALTALTDS